MISHLKSQLVRSIQKSTGGLHLKRSDAAHCLPIPSVRLLFVNVNDIKVGGKGLKWFLINSISTFTIEGPNLNPDIVYITLSESAELTSLRVLTFGKLEVSYCCRNGDRELRVSIFIGGILHSCHTVLSSMTVEEALRFISAIWACPISNRFTLECILAEHSNNSTIVLEILRKLSNSFYCLESMVTNLAPAAFKAADLHNEADIHRYKLNLAARLSRDPNFVHTTDFADMAYRTMDAYPYALEVQGSGCSVIYALCRKSAQYKQILLEGRAVEVLLRALHLCRDLEYANVIQAIMNMLLL